MRQHYQGYKIAVGVLSAIIVLQWIFIIIIAKPKKAKTVKIPSIETAKGRIAIVLDDWGYNLDNLSLLEEIKYPLTMSVLPHLNYSRRLSEELKKRGFEVILHLPLEPYEKCRLEKDTITVSLGEKAVSDIIAKGLADIAYADGVSNHMGSLATENPKTMEIIFKELKKRRLFFLDSFVTSKSVCFDLARRIGVAFARRDVFLDNKEEPEYIKRQIYKLKMKAKLYGQAIGIGHDRKGTLEVLKKTLPELKKEGYSFVLVSELVK